MSTRLVHPDPDASHAERARHMIDVIHHSDPAQTDAFPPDAANVLLAESLLDIGEALRAISAALTDDEDAETTDDADATPADLGVAVSDVISPAWSTSLKSGLSVDRDQEASLAAAPTVAPVPPARRLLGLRSATELTTWAATADLRHPVPVRDGGARWWLVSRSGDDGVYAISPSGTWKPVTELRLPVAVYGDFNPDTRQKPLTVAQLDAMPHHSEVVDIGGHWWWRSDIGPVSRVWYRIGDEKTKTKATSAELVELYGSIYLTPNGLRP